MTVLASLLTEPPPTPPPEAEIPGMGETPVKVLKRKMKEKKQIIDDVTEFPEAVNARGQNAFGVPVAQDVSEIVTDQQFLPRSSTVMRLREIREDPLTHFLPIKHTPNGTFFYAAPPGLAPELADLFMRPIRQSTTHKRPGTAAERSPAKRPRLEDRTEIDDNEIEQARRAGSRLPSLALGSDLAEQNGVSFDDRFDGGNNLVDDFNLDAKDLDAGLVQLPLDRAVSAAPSELTHLSTPGPEGTFPDDSEETYASVDCPIAIFDPQPTGTQTQTQQDIDEALDEGKGYSRNTVKALGLVRKVLETDSESVEKTLSFRQMADKVWKSYFLLDCGLTRLW